MILNLTLSLPKFSSSFSKPHSNHLFFMIWIGRVPPIFQTFKSSSLYIVGIFTCPSKYDNPGILLALKLTLHETYMIHSNEKGTELYYKVYEVMNPRYFHKSYPILRTNLTYSGTLKSHPKGIITNHS